MKHPIIGKALKVIYQRSPQLFAAIPEGRQIIDFGNLLTHEYQNVSDSVVWVPSRLIYLRHDHLRPDPQTAG
jgi:hypothetical protein